jgi:hypothetical protein
LGFNPGSFHVAGYSKTPLAQKLGIKDGHTLALLSAPADFERTLGKVPPGVRVMQAIGKPGSVDVAVVFVKSRRDLEKRFARVAAAMKPNGGMWVAWPKKASGVATDLTEDVVRDVALPKGLVDNKVCAIDETWSGLRLVWRVENRPRRAKT